MPDLARPSINADAVFRDVHGECAALYRQFCRDFGGSVARIRAYYRWHRAPLVRALRIGREVQRARAATR